MLRLGAKVSTYDTNPPSCREFNSSLAGPDSDGITIQSDFPEAQTGHTLVVDATNAAGIIGAEDISSQTFVAAPGMPLGVCRAAQTKLSDRLLLDPLQIGIATMGMEIVKQIIRM